MAIIIQPSRVPEEGEHLAGAEPGEVLELDPQGEVHAEGPVRYDLHVLYVNGELVVTGMVEVRIGRLCSRCGEPCVQAVREPAFTSTVEVPNPHASVDLTDEVRESMILNFATYPLCQPACRGLCPRCGANLNTTVCRCEKPMDEHWGAFDAL